MCEFEPRHRHITFDYMSTSVRSKASFIYDVVQSAAEAHVHQNSSAHGVCSGHLDTAAVLAHGSPQWPIGRRHR